MGETNSYVHGSNLLVIIHGFMLETVWRSSWKGSDEDSVQSNRRDAWNRSSMEPGEA